MAPSGADSGQAHLLSLLRAIRLRLESPDAHPDDDSGAADTAAVDPTVSLEAYPLSRLPMTSPLRAVPPSSGAALQTPAGSAVQVPPGSAVVPPTGSPGAGPDAVVVDSETVVLPADAVVVDSETVVLPADAVVVDSETVVLPADVDAAAVVVDSEAVVLPPHPYDVAGRGSQRRDVPGTPRAADRRPAGVRAAQPTIESSALPPLNAARTLHARLITGPAPGTGTTGGGPLKATGPVGPVIPPLGRPNPGGHPPPPLPPPGTGPGWPIGSPPTGGPHSPVGAPHGHVAAPTHGLSADGWDPADDVALHELQDLLSNSLSLAGDVDAVADRLRHALVLAQPRLAAVLPGAENVQRELLAKALSWLVDVVDQPPLMAAGCRQLGAVLREFGVAPPQLQLIGAALAEAMRAGMAHAWRQEHNAAWRTTWRHAHEWIAHGFREAAYQPVTWAAVVVSHERRRSDLAVLRLRPLLPMPFRAGQYTRIEVTDLPGVWRPYSPAGVHQADNTLELHVRARSDQGVSGTLVHRAAPGDLVRLTRPEGAMVLPEAGDRDLLLIAGDTGVAPMKALLRELADTGDPRAAVLFWGVRTLGDLYDLTGVSALAQACRRTTVVPVVSQGPPGPYASGLVTDAVAAYGEWSRHEVFLAGPPAMLAATRAVLLGLGLADERIHHDDPTAVDAR